MIIVIAIALSVLTGHIIGSENPEVRTLLVDLGRLSRGCLFYNSKNAVDTCNAIEIQCSYNMPFLSLNQSLGSYVNPSRLTKKDDLSDYSSDVQQRIKRQIAEYAILPKVVREIRALPLSVFQNRQADGTLCFLKLKAELCYKLMLKNSQSKELTEKPESLEQAISDFREQPNYYPEDKDWLIGQCFLEERDGQVVHGSEGYFRDEYAQQKESEQEKN